MVHRKLLIYLTVSLVFVATTSLFANDISFLSFGAGKTEVRLYTDYFCGPCSNLERRIEALTIDLVKRNVITIIFIDTPFYTFSAFYAKYFLYVLNEKKDITYAFKARTALFDAAKDMKASQEKLNPGGKISAKERVAREQERVERFLTKRGIGFKPFDARPVFNVLSGYLREDKINSTPTCVIYDGDKKEICTGTTNIMKAFENLKGVRKLSGG